MSRWKRARVAVVIASLAASAAAESADPTLILVSLDGFRPDYLQRYEAPTLERLAAQGVQAPRGMVPAFPTKTFPNHYTIVTGLYPANHGIVGNTMYDPELDAWFRISDRDAVEDGRWWGGEPIWVTAELQGVTSATFFWVGSEAPVKGVRPTHWRRFDGDVPGHERVDTVLGWLDLEGGDRPRFVSLYFETTDDAGHRFGPFSEEVGAAVREVDGYLSRLLEGLSERGIESEVDLVVVSDHGMSGLSDERILVLSDWIDIAGVEPVQLSPILTLRPPPERVDAIYSKLRGAHPQMTVYRRENVAERFHYRGHHRISPLLLLAGDGWRIAMDEADASRMRARPLAGDHGFDNALESMRALFIARGPSFRNGVESEPFENVHLYELMARVLGLEPAPNDGRLAAVSHLLR